MELFFFITKAVNNCSVKTKRIMNGMYNRPNDSPFVKDGINNYIVNNEDTINPKKQGTKAAVWFEEENKAGASAIFQDQVKQKPG
jgi:hypothetical protein